MATTTESVSTLGSALGAPYIGAMISAMLFGVTNFQIYFYFRKYKQDRPFQKCIVIYLWLLDTSHMAFVTAHLWHYLIDSFGNVVALQYVNWSYRLQMTMMLVIIASVQSLYTWRIRILSRQKSRFWPWIMTCTLMSVYAAVIILMFQTYTIVKFSDYAHAHWSIYLAFSMGSFGDIMLTIGLCNLLYVGRMGSAETRSMVGIVVRYVIISGMLTSMGAIAGLVTFCIMPNSSVPFGIILVLTKVYINSFLALLNARKSIRNSVANTLQISDIDGRVQGAEIDSRACTEETARFRAAQDKFIFGGFGIVQGRRLIRLKFEGGEIGTQPRVVQPQLFMCPAGSHNLRK